MIHIALTRALTGVALFGLAACSGGPQPADTARIADGIKADVTQLIAQYNAHDAQKAVSHDASDFVGMFHGGPNVIGPDGDLAATRQQVADPAVKFAVTHDTITVAAAGDMATYRALYHYTFTDPATKQPRTEMGNWVVGYRKQADGSMKIAWSVVSDLPPAKIASIGL